MTFAEKMTAIADKIRILSDSSEGMDLDLMASSLETEKTNIANAFSAVASMGGTLPSSQVSANLASAISTISTGVEIQQKSGNFSTDMSGFASVSLGFKPDFVAIRDSSSVNGKSYVGAMFTMSGSSSIDVLIPIATNNIIFSGVTLKPTSNGFTASATKLLTDLDTPVDAGRSLSYTAWKYT